MLRTVLLSIIKIDFFWFFLKYLSKIGVRFLYYRNLSKNKLTDKYFLSTIFQELTVLNGPFKGMKYPKLDSEGSRKLPKLLGSYEKELWDIINFFTSREYTEIIDIGCAEGYYAVGFALKSKAENIYAFDISEKARVLCSEMASLNKVSHKVKISSKCTPKTLNEFDFKNKGLIISDCEGYEKELFTKTNSNNLKKCDLLIEIHSFVDPKITARLVSIFNETHDITFVESISDTEKALFYKFDQVKFLNYNEKRLLMEEGRPDTMKWMIGISKSSK